MIECLPQIRDRPVGETTAKSPGAFSVFGRFGIEFCCQDHVPLAEAVKNRALDLADLIALSRKVESVHANDQAALASFEAEFKADLIAHIHPELNALFPRFENAGHD